MDGETWRATVHAVAKCQILLLSLLGKPYSMQVLSKWGFKKVWGTSLVVQWLRLSAPNAGDLSSTPGLGTRSHVLTKSLPTITKTQHSQIINK